MTLTAPLNASRSVALEEAPVALRAISSPSHPMSGEVVCHIPEAKIGTRRILAFTGKMPIYGYYQGGSKDSPVQSFVITQPSHLDLLKAQAFLLGDNVEIYMNDSVLLSQLPPSLYPKVTFLSFSYGSVIGNEIDYLLNFSNLKHLSWGGEAPEGASNVINHLTGLRSLIAPFSGLDPRNLTDLKNLRELCLDDVYLKGDQFEALEAFTKLRRLSLNGSTITTDAAKSIATLTNLKKLSLAQGLEGDESAKILLGSLAKNFTDLNIRSHAMTPEGVAWVKQVASEHDIRLSESFYVSSRL